MYGFLNGFACGVAVYLLQHDYSSLWVAVGLSSVSYFCGFVSGCKNT